tara:strand:- start:394 stop:714 length:321 start_codon:yes stop_codon:yes gene_type:complete
MSDGEPEIAPPCVYDVMAAIPDPCLDPRQSLLKASDLSEANRLIDRLPPHWAKVMRLRYGIDGDGSQTLKSIARRTGLSRQRVGQIERRALKQIIHRFMVANKPLV